jgi:hypothetical protein
MGGGGGGFVKILGLVAGTLIGGPIGMAVAGAGMVGGSMMDAQEQKKAQEKMMRDQQERQNSLLASMPSVSDLTARAAENPSPVQKEVTNNSPNMPSAEQAAAEQLAQERKLVASRRGRLATILTNSNKADNATETLGG